MKANTKTAVPKGKTAIAATGKAGAAIKVKTGAAKAKEAAAAVAAGAGRGPGPGGPSTPPINHTAHRVWDSGELQQQIGSKNKDKKKLVMQVWYEYFQDTATSYIWSVHCSLKAEDKKLVGSGWDAVNKLSSVSYNFTYKLGSIAAPVTASATNTINNRSDTTMMLISGTVSNTAQLPVFQSKHVTGVRSGGPSGISLTW